MKIKNEYYILLYYCYTRIEDPEKFREEHHKLCLNLNLRGRIIVAHEGLNGTVSGLRTDCQTYVDTLRSDLRFARTDFKVDTHEQHVFKKLNVRHKSEIVHSDLIHIDLNKKTGTYLNPTDFKQVKDDSDVILLDVRSNYEHKLGKFKGAITLNIEHFRELPQKVNELEVYKDKKIITYCTGGIKCEKASAYLLEQGFENVYQLHGGIIKYGIEVGGEDFEGECYVFDNRIKTKVNRVNPSIISRCHVCNKVSNHVVNCANASCNLHTVICQSCMLAMEGTCSQKCKEAPDKRPYNTEGYYATTPNGYNPYKGCKR